MISRDWGGFVSKWIQGKRWIALTGVSRPISPYCSINYIQKMRHTPFLRIRGASSVEIRSSSSSASSANGPPNSPFLEFEEEEYVRVGFRLPPRPNNRRGIWYWSKDTLDIVRLLHLSYGMRVSLMGEFLVTKTLLKVSPHMPADIKIS